MPEVTPNLHANLIQPGSIVFSLLSSSEPTLQQVSRFEAAFSIPEENRVEAAFSRLEENRVEAAFSRLEENSKESSVCQESSNNQYRTGSGENMQVQVTS